MPLRAATLAAGLLACLAGVPASAAGLDCGRPPAHYPKADAALAGAMPAVRPDGASSATLTAAVRELRSDGVPRAVIVDHAVAAYCPLVARDDSLSADGKREAIRRFAALLTNIVYDPLDPSQGETAIVLTLPVKPALSEQIDAAAAKAGLTRDGWLLRTIQEGLKGG